MQSSQMEMSAFVLRTISGYKKNGVATFSRDSDGSNPKITLKING